VSVTLDKQQKERLYILNSLGSCPSRRRAATLRLAVKLITLTFCTAQPAVSSCRSICFRVFCSGKRLFTNGEDVP